MKIFTAILFLVSTMYTFAVETLKYKAVTDTVGFFEMKNELDSVSYAIGVQMGENLKNNGLDSSLNIDILAYGIFQVLNNKKIIFGGDTLSSVLMKHFNTQAHAAMQENEIKGKKFFEENAKRPGVKITSNGLQYEVIKEGKGARPKMTDEVTVEYVGTLLDGSTFDKTSDRDKPTTFPLNQVISGFAEGLQLMTIGSKYKLFIPGNLAYGSQGQQQAGINPNETLIFEVKLIGINKKSKSKKNKPEDETQKMQKMIEEAMKKQ